MNEINRFPDGLLALLDLKTRGQTPNSLNQVVAPGLDMLPFYELGQGMDWVQNAGNTAALNATAPVIVPAGEIWLVRQAYIKLQALAVATISAQLTAGPGNNLLNLRALASMDAGVGQFQFTPSAIGQTCVLNWQPSVPFLARPGWGFYVFTDVQSAAFTGETCVLRSVYRS